MLIKLLKTPKIWLGFLAVLLAVKTNMWIDPDFGWRLKTGEYILQNGIPKIDLYTYTMSSFPWVDHAWSQDVLFFLIYTYIGNFALSTLFALISLFALLIQFHRKEDKLTTQTISVFLMTFSALLPFVGVRVQMASWLLFSIFIYLLSHRDLWTKFRFFVPLYFILWANIHGGFSIGLLVFFVYSIFGLFKKDEGKLFNLGLAAVSLVATLVNPYGTYLFREVWSSVSDNRLRWEIIEWRPAFLSFDIPTLSLIALFVILVFRYRQKLDHRKIVISLVLLVEGIISIRNIPFFMLFAVSILLESFQLLYEEISNYGKVLYKKIRIERFNQAVLFLLIYASGAFLLQTYFSFKGASYLSEEKFYPRGAVEFLKHNDIEGEIISEYGWGGYLIWKYPKKKVFIDGRMPSWSWNGNNENESNNAMTEYLVITKGKENYKDYFDKYNIRVVLISTQKPKDVFRTIENKLNNRISSLSGKFGIESSDFSLSETLEGEGWSKVYEDDVARIYLVQ